MPYQSTVFNTDSEIKRSFSQLNVVSLFSGCGGLDLGFEKAGFNILWANEYDKDIWETYRHNHQNTFLDTRSITEIPSEEVPECDGIIGGPPCQSWSEGGSKRGLNDKRGQLFWDYIRILNAKSPKFFVAENVKGMLMNRYGNALDDFKKAFSAAGEFGYDLYFFLVNAADYDVPEDRERVLFIGFRKDLHVNYRLPAPTSPAGKRITLRQAIGDLAKKEPKGFESVVNTKNDWNTEIPNHDYLVGGFSSIFLSRNRVRSWDEMSYTIQASGRQCPLHPQAPKMRKINENKHVFIEGQEHLYRRFSVREVARIQTFPDDFILRYNIYPQDTR